MSYVFGPVPSRRLGRSLGVDPIPFKVCNFGCVYCQIGQTTKMINDRRDFFPPEDILAELATALATHAGGIDWITFTGEGEPTLCKSLGRLIRGARELSDVPIAVITNASLFDDPEVRADVAAADLAMPSLDAADPETFRRIDRPHGKVDVADIVEGLVAFREEYAGTMWLEIMLCKGLNDDEKSLLALREAVDRIRPEKVWINTPVRPPAEGGVEIPDEAGIARARRILGPIALPDPAPPTALVSGATDPAEQLLDVLRRHPMREDQVPDAFPAFDSDRLATVLDSLRSSGRLREIRRGADLYLTTAEGRYRNSEPA